MPRNLFLSLVCTIGFAAATHGRVTDDAVFIHHSCGSNWLNAGLNSALIAKTYIDERNDVGYGTTMSPDAGRPTSLGSVPGDQTDMQHWILWFNDYLGRVKVHGCATGVNRIIMFKSCYPNSNVTADGTEPGNPFSGTHTVTNYKAVFRHPSGPGSTYTNSGYTYLPLEDIFAANPDTLFVYVTSPPRAYAPSDETNNAEAHRARLFNDWLKNTWLPAYNAANPGLDNVVVFDMFDLLAYPDTDTLHPNRLRYEYGGAAGDSHPNYAGNTYLTQVFATNTPNVIDVAWDAFITRLVADANSDGYVNVGDLQILVAAWGKTLGGAGYDARADFDKNNTINVGDLQVLVANWGTHS